MRTGGEEETARRWRGDGEKKEEEEEEIHQFIYPENEGRKEKRHIVCIYHSVSFSTLCL